MAAQAVFHGFMLPDNQICSLKKPNIDAQTQGVLGTEDLLKLVVNWSFSHPHHCHYRGHGIGDVCCYTILL